MDDRTLIAEPVAAGEQTQMVGSVSCPVCQEQNVSGAVWCAECGFRMDTTPGESAEVAPAMALVGGGQRYPLKAGENVVGRLNADVFLSDPSVSRRHAIVTVTKDAVTVRDEGSSNGTRLNGMRIEPGAEAPVGPGEEVRFGAITFTLDVPEGVEIAVPPAREIGAPGEPSAEPSLEAGPAVAVLTNGVDTWPLHAGPNTIGRREGNDVVLPDPAVSGRHATITIEAGTARVADAGSTNGTFIADQRVLPGAEAIIEPDAKLRFGRVVLNYEVIPPESGLVVAGEDAQAGPELEVPVMSEALDDESPGGEAPRGESGG